MYQHRLLATGTSCVRSLVKGVASPVLLCKALYFTSATLSGISYATSSLCLLYGYSSIAPIPLLAGSLACGTSVGAGGL